MGEGSQKEVYLKKKAKKKKKNPQKKSTFLKRKINNKKFFFPSMLCGFLFSFFSFLPLSSVTLN